MLLPVLARSTFDSGPQVFGVLSAAASASARWPARCSPASLGRASRKALLVGTGGFAVAQLLLAPATLGGRRGALLAVTGLCFTLWTANANSSLQLGAPDHLRGRVIGLYYFAFNGTGPVGGLLAGWLAASGGTGLAFAVSGAVALATTGALLVVRRPMFRTRLVPATQR